MSRFFKVFSACLVLGLSIGGGSCSTPIVSDHADLIVVNASILTMADDQSRVEALAVRDGRVMAVGSSAEIEKWVGPKTERVDAKGRFLMPGFIDSHGHFRGLGQMKRLVDLVGASSYEEVVRRVGEAAKNTPKGTWLKGRGWDQNLWAEKTFPRHQLLSQQTPDHPVLLTRVDGHALLANAVAMKIAGVTRETPNPSGGEIIRDARGNATGVFVDLAERLIHRAMPAATTKEVRRDLLSAQQEAFRHGVTSFHDCGASYQTIEQMRQLYKSADLKIRLFVMYGGSGTIAIDFDRLGEPSVGEYDHHLTLRTIKLGVDGSLGSRGAALLEDYADRPGHRGLTLLSKERLLELSREALKRGWQVAVHAIGDRGNHMVLNAWDELFAEQPEGKNARFRMEHVQMLDGKDIPRLAPMGLIASMQTCHGTSDLAWAKDRIGVERVEEGAYAWQKIIATGAVFCNGTDTPVEPVSPFNNLDAAILRDFGEGKAKSGYHAEQRLTRWQALNSYTTAGAYASFEEKIKGRLLPGMLADFVILNQDLMTCPEIAIKATKVLRTVVAGETVYRALAKPIR
ncbi:MAG: amidohydrolase [Planctomycetota bacterium]